MDNVPGSYGFLLRSKGCWGRQADFPDSFPGHGFDEAGSRQRQLKASLRNARRVSRSWSSGSQGNICLSSTTQDTVYNPLGV